MEQLTPLAILLGIVVFVMSMLFQGEVRAHLKTRKKLKEVEQAAKDLLESNEKLYRFQKDNRSTLQ